MLGWVYVIRSKDQLLGSREVLNKEVCKDAWSSGKMNPGNGQTDARASPQSCQMWQC